MNWKFALITLFTISTLCAEETTEENTLAQVSKPKKEEIAQVTDVAVETATQETDNQ